MSHSTQKPVILVTTDESFQPITWYCRTTNETIAYNTQDKHKKPKQLNLTNQTNPGLVVIQEIDQVYKSDF